MADLHARNSKALQAFDPSAWRKQANRRSAPAAHAPSSASLHLLPLASFAGAFLGCLATLYLSKFALPPALASAAVTLLLCAALIAAPTKGLVPTTFSSSVYGGSFSGMTPIVTLTESVARSGLPVDASFLLLSLFAGLVFCIVCGAEVRMHAVLLRGYGGRFGALAAVASFLFLTLAPLLGVAGEPFRLAGLDGFEDDLAGVVAIFALCAAGMALTMLGLRLPRVAGTGRAVRIFVSATVAFAGLAALQQFWPGKACLANAYYAGCFLGMSSPQRLRGLWQPVLAAAALTVFLFQASTILPAVGGSLGLAAFVTVAGVDAASRVMGVAATSLAPGWLLFGRGLAGAFAVASVLLPNGVFFQRPVDDTTASIRTPEKPPAAETVRVDVPPKASGAPPTMISTPLATAPVAVTTPEVPALVAAPERREAPRVRRRANPSLPAVQPVPAEPASRRVIRLGQTAASAPPAPAAKRSQIRVVPQPAPQSPAARPDEAPVMQQTLPEGPTVPLH